MRKVVVRSFFWVKSTFKWRSFFRSSLIFFEINVTNIIMADDNRMVTIAVVIIIIIIIYLVFTNFLIGKSSMFFLY